MTSSFDCKKLKVINFTFEQYYLVLPLAIRYKQSSIPVHHPKLLHFKFTSFNMHLLEIRSSTISIATFQNDQLIDYLCPFYFAVLPNIAQTLICIIRKTSFEFVKNVDV